VRVERSAIGGGTPGEATSRLRKAWLDTVEAQTSA
jgi:hypothetical protein